MESDFLKTLDEEISEIEAQISSLHSQARESIKKRDALLRAKMAYVGAERRSSSGSPAVQHAVEILRHQGRPMRTIELMPLVFARGVTFFAKNKANVLSSLLSRSHDIVSKGGHIGWALREWEPTENVGTHENHVGTHEK